MSVLKKGNYLDHFVQVHLRVKSFKKIMRGCVPVRVEQRVGLQEKTASW